MSYVPPENPLDYDFTDEGYSAPSNPLDFDFSPPVIPLDKSWVVGIEKIKTSFTGTSTSVTLTSVGGSGYDGYLIPFFTFSYSGVSTSVISPFFTDVYFSGTPGNVSINFQRGESGGTCYVTGYVIEVDINEVTIQTGTFSITHGGFGTTSSVTEVDTSKAFHIQYYRYAYGGSEYFYDAWTRTYFSSTTQLTHDRGANHGTTNGHWYVIEDQGNNFDVQHADPDINASTSGEDTISSVDMSKSFVVASHYNSYGARSAWRCGAAVWLKNDTTVRAEQGASSTSIVRAQVITLTDSDAYVERGSQSYANGVGSDADTLSQSLDLDYSIAWIPTLASVQWVDTNDRNNAAFFRAELTGVDEITTSRQATDTGAVVKWEAVQFQLPPPPPETVVFSGGIKMSNVIIK